MDFGTGTILNSNNNKIRDLPMEDCSADPLYYYLPRYYGTFKFTYTSTSNLKYVLYDAAECSSTKFKSPPCPRKADGPDSEFSQDHRTCLGSAWSTLVHAPELREVCRCIAVIGITPGILILKYHIIIYP